MEFVSHVSLDEALGPRYLRLIEEHPDLWSIFTLSSGLAIGYVNRAVVTWSGREVTDLVGAAWPDLLGPGSTEAWCDKLFALQAGQVVHADWRPKGQDGASAMRLVSRLTPLADLSGKPCCVVAHQSLEIEPSRCPVPSTLLDQADHRTAMRHADLFNRLCAVQYAVQQRARGRGGTEGIQTAVRAAFAELEQLETRGLARNSMRKGVAIK
ncbi:hypothetical protein [Acanthopleuribacter pedis]|uniref:Uncharacterized protein n=1 Tax=Acanthopleuribacter pedis TaxID=442870 RepID=A0A8J7QAF8_9BACT|nr:hypothetical protein [Acanthopleuribacter pedis]MBO1320817.1 hypothetical protein [Acanthopleuribacter pedis]